MHSLRPDLCLALADDAFRFGGPAWTPERALDIAAQKGVEESVPDERRALEAAMRPAPAQWMADRLTVLWATYMAARTAPDPRALAVWMAETSRMLIDIPHDIIAHSIDTAMQKSRHGFIPSIGEIRQFAEPLAEERTQQLARLGRMERALADPEATAERKARREELAAHADHMASIGRRRAESDALIKQEADRLRASPSAASATASDQGAR